MPDTSVVCKEEDFKLFKNKYNFVREELKDLPEFSELPKGKLKDFTSRIKYALLLGLKEKEIF